MVAAFAFTVAPSNAGAYVFTCFSINVLGKGFSLFALWAMVTSAHSLVWFEDVSVFNHCKWDAVVTLGNTGNSCYYLLLLLLTRLTIRLTLTLKLLNLLSSLHSLLAIA